VVIERSRNAQQPFGNKKILLAIVVPDRLCREGKALSRADLTPLVLKVNASWKSDEIITEIKKHIEVKQISYCISDTGSNLIRAFKSLNCKHIPDINHKFSLMIQYFDKLNNHQCLKKILFLLPTQKP
jgi:hypothetical protein